MSIVRKSIMSLVAGAVALSVVAVPAVAAAQEPGYPYQPPPRYVVREPSVTPFTVVPPAFASVFVYEGARLLARLDGPGVLWVPTGGAYRVVAMRGDQVIWSGDRVATGAPLEVRWPAPPGYDPRSPCPYAYPRGPLTAPVERGRVRTPLP